MILSEYLKTHRGEVVRIGTKTGTGFVFAGTVDSFTLNYIERLTHVKMHDREVVCVYPSAYVGQIVIVVGSESGHAECPQYDRAEVLEDVPIENYQRLIDYIAQSAAEDYEHALVTWYTSPREQGVKNADREIYECERFFRSPLFAVLMPNADGGEILRLIEQKVKKNLRINDDE